MDLFEREQQVFDKALEYWNETRLDTSSTAEAYGLLVKEYGKILKQLRMVTKISDRTTVDLNMEKLDLLNQVSYDALTGIYNRRFMEERLKQVIASLSRCGGTLSVLMMDIDFFKKYNDTYGHDKGDECLRLVAMTLRDSVTRADDFVARYGGEEFIAVLSNTDEKGARTVSQKILENIRNRNIPHYGNGDIGYVTISIGATTGKVSHEQSGAEYIRQADKALYEAKRAGRNRFEFITL